MSEPQRYDFSGDWGVPKHDGGDYVHYDDYLTLASRLAACEAEQDMWFEQAHLLDSERDTLRAENVRLREALEAIAKNTCCNRCQEAALVARHALKREP